MNPISRMVAASLLVLSQMLSPASAGNDDSAVAAAMINEMLSNVYNTNKSHGPAQLPSAIMPYFDFDWWTEFLIKTRRDRFTQDQFGRVRQLMPGYIAHLYHKRFSDGLDRQPSVHGSRSVNRSVLVETQFYRAGGKLEVKWRVRDRSRRAQVYDIMVGGISFVLMTRDEFVAIVDRSGPQGLISYLESVSF